eukprot:387751-Rhodomonas_salina.1
MSDERRATSDERRATSDERLQYCSAVSMSAERRASSDEREVSSMTVAAKCALQFVKSIAAKRISARSARYSKVIAVKSIAAKQLQQ